jgi:hypothetical protein
MNYPTSNTDESDTSRFMHQFASRVLQGLKGDFLLAEILLLLYHQKPPGPSDQKPNPRGPYDQNIPRVTPETINV